MIPNQDPIEGLDTSNNEIYTLDIVENYADENDIPSTDLQSLSDYVGQFSDSGPTLYQATVRYRIRLNGTEIHIRKITVRGRDRSHLVNVIQQNVKTWHKAQAHQITQELLNLGLSPTPPNP